MLNISELSKELKHFRINYFCRFCSIKPLIFSLNAWNLKITKTRLHSFCLVIYTSLLFHFSSFFSAIFYLKIIVSTNWNFFKLFEWLWVQRWYKFHTIFYHFRATFRTLKLSILAFGFLSSLSIFTFLCNMIYHCVQI